MLKQTIPRASDTAARLLIAALLGLVVAVVCYQLPWRGAFNVGDPWDMLLLRSDGFHDAEQGGGIDFRWSKGSAELELPGLAGAEEVQLSLWMAGRADGQVATLWVDGREIESFNLLANPQQYSATILTAQLAGGVLHLELTTTSAVPEGDTRDLGLLLDRVMVEKRTGGPVMPDLLGLLAAMAIMSLAGLVGGRPGLLAGVLAALGIIAGLLLARPWFGLVAPFVLLLSLAAMGAVVLYRRSEQATRRWSALWLALGLFAIYTLLVPGHFYVIDDDEKYRVAEAMLTRGSFEMEPPVDGRVYSKYGLGHSLASVPLLAAGLVAEALVGRGENEDLRVAFVSLLNPICTAVAAGLLFVFAERLGASYRRALLIALAFAFATFAFPHALFAFSEPLISLLLLASFYTLFRAGQELANKWLLASGALLGFLVLTKLEFVLLVPLFALYFVYKARGKQRQELVRAGVWFIAPLAVFALILLGYNAVRYGNPLSSGYASEPFSTPLWEGLYGLLLSSGKTVFLYAPPLLLALVAWPEFLRRWRAEAVLISAIVVGALLFYAGWWQWSGDWTWGPRFLLPFVPLVLLALSTFDFRPRVARVGCGLVLALGVLAQVPGVLADWRLLFLRFATAEEALAHNRALWFDPTRSPLLLNARQLVIGPDIGASLHPADFRLPQWTELWIPALLVALLLVAVALLARGWRAERYAARAINTPSS